MIGFRRRRKSQRKWTSEYKRTKQKSISLFKLRTKSKLKCKLLKSFVFFKTKHKSIFLNRGHGWTLVNCKNLNSELNWLYNYELFCKSQCGRFNQTLYAQICANPRFKLIWNFKIPKIYLTKSFFFILTYKMNELNKIMITLMEFREEKKIHSII